VRLLLDSHALIWWLAGDEALSPTARAAVAEAPDAVLVSAASAWEIAIKHRIGKLPSVRFFVGRMETTLREQGFEALPVTLRHAERGGMLDPHHRDPFDRLLIAQALLEDLTLVSRDALFDRYGVQRLW